MSSFARRGAITVAVPGVLLALRHYVPLPVSRTHAQLIIAVVPVVTALAMDLVRAVRASHRDPHRRQGQQRAGREVREPRRHISITMGNAGDPGLHLVEAKRLARALGGD